jgi:hypothetical protein
LRRDFLGAKTAGFDGQWELTRNNQNLRFRPPQPLPDHEGINASQRDIRKPMYNAEIARTEKSDRQPCGGIIDECCYKKR